MHQLVIEGTTRTNQTMLDHGITDLFVHDTADGAVLYATSGPNGGLTAYAVDPDGSLSMLDYAHFHHSFAGGALDQMSLISTSNGLQMVVASDDDGRLTAYSLSGDGAIGGANAITGVVSADAALLTLDQWGSDMLFLANDAQHSIQGYAIGGPNLLLPQFTVTDAQGTYAQSVFALDTVSIGGVDYLLAASASERGISAYRIGAQGLVTTGNLGVAEGIGIMTPTTLATAQIGGRHFVLLGSAPGDGLGQSAAITVMELRPDGSLQPADHVVDTLHTRFGLIQSLDVITANGFTYVFAAGGDAGLSLFILMPNGRLQLIDVIADTFGTGLDNVTSIASVQTATDLSIFVSSEISAGITELSIDTSRNGAMLTAGASGGRLDGTARNDIVIGGAGDDLLNGSFGDDILEDGAGGDTLTGGGGRDIFVLRTDGEIDLITDFEPGRDRLDLSDWPFLYDPALLTVQSTVDGAIVTWRDETLVIRTLQGISLTAADIHGAVIASPTRTPSFDAVLPPAPDAPLDLEGTANGDLIRGRDGHDTIQGLDGNDTLFGGLGNDSILGGAQNDRLHGEGGQDTLLGGFGNDTLFGDAGTDLLIGFHGRDVIYGGTGHDRIDGGLDDDRLFGDAGNDTILGGDGNDSIVGGTDNDRLQGNNGNDTLLGGLGDDILLGDDGNDFLMGFHGRDEIQGGSGHDRIDGGLDHDRLFGDAGNDTILGGDGNDSLIGGTGNDRLQGDRGHDTLIGGIGDDTLFGNDGTDLLIGFHGRDVIHGGTGADRIEGGLDDDRLFGDAGNDTILGGAGNDSIAGGMDHDRLQGDGGNDTLIGGLGNDTLFGGDGPDFLMGYHGRDEMFGGTGNDRIDGGLDADRLFGNAGSDTLIGGAGNDQLWGGLNADTFVFANGHGSDTIWDFDARSPLERIDLSQVTALSSIADILGPNGAATQVGAHVRIDTGDGNLIWLMNVSLRNLDVSDFLL